MKALIQKAIFSLENDIYLSDQVKWKLLKYEICKFTISFSRKLAQNARKLQRDLEAKIKNLEQNITDEDKFNEYKTAITLLLESKFEVNAIGINTGKNLEKKEKKEAGNGTVKKIIKMTKNILTN